MMTGEELNKLARMAADDALKHGYHDNEKPMYRTFVKACVELGEAVNAFRDGKYPDVGSFNDGLVNIERNISRAFAQNQYFVYYYNKFVKNTVVDELTDVVIYALDVAGNINADLTVPEPRGHAYWHNRMAEVDHDFLMVAGILMRDITREDYMQDVWRKIFDIIQMVETWLDEMGYELEFWLEQKMRYNKLRPRRHGRENDPTI